MERSSRLVVAFAVAAALPALASAEALYLHVVPVSVPESGPPDPTTPLRVAARVARPDAFAAAAGSAWVRPVGDDRVEIDLADYPQLEPREPERFRAASFVVDFEEPSVARLRSQLVGQSGGVPSIDALRRFTGDAITRKSMERGWDLASQVAASRVGDCTEHAVLLAALARSVGRPARVAVGLFIVARDGQYHAFGHAWTEIHDGARWLAVDATPQPEVERVAYLPLLLLRDEGPGYALPLARALQSAWIRHLEVLGGGPPK